MTCDVFDENQAGCMSKYSYDIKLRGDAEPVVDGPRRIAFTLLDKVKAELERMESLGVIVKVDEATEWVNSMVIVQQPGKLRICLDPSNLNQYIIFY